jgi:hypothetical protein
VPLYLCTTTICEKNPRGLRDDTPRMPQGRYPKAVPFDTEAVAEYAVPIADDTEASTDDRPVTVYGIAMEIDPEDG